MTEETCGQWMPLAKQACARPVGHKGDHLTVGAVQKQLESKRESTRRYREANLEQERERVRESNRKWREANLEQAREQDRESARRWREANPEKFRENMRKWQQANPDKLRAKDRRRRERELNAADRYTDLTSRCKVCYLCQQPLDQAATVHVEHVYPLSRIADEMPDDYTSILLLACEACNLSKSDATLIEWIERRVRAGERVTIGIGRN